MSLTTLCYPSDNVPQVRILMLGNRTRRLAVKQFMGWKEVPSFRTSEDQDDHPYLLAKSPTANNLNVQLPIDSWLVRKCTILIPWWLKVILPGILIGL